MKNNAEKANRIMALVAEGYSFEEAIEKVLEERDTKVIVHAEIIHSKVWVPLGSLRCPHCGVYSNLYAMGHEKSKNLRLTCKVHGTYYRTAYNMAWKTKEELDSLQAKIV
jgi:hypothetical protein